MTPEFLSGLLWDLIGKDGLSGKELETWAKTLGNEGRSPSRSRDEEILITAEEILKKADS